MSQPSINRKRHGNRSFETASNVQTPVENRKTLLFFLIPSSSFKLPKLHQYPLSLAHKSSLHPASLDFPPCVQANSFHVSSNLSFPLLYLENRTSGIFEISPRLLPTAGAAPTGAACCQHRIGTITGHYSSGDGSTRISRSHPSNALSLAVV